MVNSTPDTESAFVSELDELLQWICHDDISINIVQG